MQHLVGGQVQKQVKNLCLWKINDCSSTPLFVSLPNILLRIEFLDREMKEKCATDILILYYTKK